MRKAILVLFVFLFFVFGTAYADMIKKSKYEVAKELAEDACHAKCKYSCWNSDPTAWTRCIDAELEKYLKMLSRDKEE